MCPRAEAPVRFGNLPHYRREPHRTDDWGTVVSTEATLVSAPETAEPTEDVILDEVLVEEISIDGMCGVY